jgi:hypothetical protein
MTIEERLAELERELVSNPDHGDIILLQINLLKTGKDYAKPFIPAYIKEKSLPLLKKEIKAALF